MMSFQPGDQALSKGNELVKIMKDYEDDTYLVQVDSKFKQRIHRNDLSNVHLSEEKSDIGCVVRIGHSYIESAHGNDAQISKSLRNAKYFSRKDAISHANHFGGRVLKIKLTGLDD